jgi:hypothetical protein
MPTDKAWTAMSDAEKIEWLYDKLHDFINHQDGANARMSTRIKTLEEAKAQIDKARS